MRRFKNILLAACRGEGEQNSLKRAVALAKENAAKLTIIDVIEDAPIELRVLSGHVIPANFKDFITCERTANLKEHVKYAQEQGVHVLYNVLLGVPFIEIIRQVIQEDHDLLVISAGPLGLSERVFGCTSLHLMRKCPCPVWLEKSGQQPKGRRILAAVDPAPMGQQLDSVNRMIMDLSVSLMRHEGQALHILHSWSPIKERILRRHSVTPQAQVNWWDRETLNAHRDRLKNLLAGYSMDDLKYQVHLLRGEPSALISEEATKHDIDLIVVGASCRTGLAGFFMGNTAENILQHGTCSVLMVKPDGFVSPVEVGEAS